MKYVAAALLLWSVGTQAQTYTLTSDQVDPNATYVDIRVDGASVLDCSPAVPCITAGVIDYDVSALVALGNPFQVDAAACNMLAQCSTYSIPLVVVPGAPSPPVGVRIQVLPNP